MTVTDEYLEYPMVAGVRFVKTAEGAKRFGAPIGSRIEVDKDGKVTRLTTPDEPSVKAAPAKDSTKVDPNRTPTKFVPTVPGQKAKIDVPTPAPGAGNASNPNGGLPTAQANAVTDWTQIEKYLGNVSEATRAALTKIRTDKPLSEQDKAQLRGMILKILNKLNPPEKKSEPDKKGKGGKEERTAAQKAATEKAQEASTESTSAAKKAAQAKAQKAASEASAYERALRAAFVALGGDPDQLPASDAEGAQNDSSGSKAPAKGTGSGAGAPGPAGGEDGPSGGFTSMTNKELGAAIRGMTQMMKTNPSGQLRSRLLAARIVMLRRKKRELDRQRRLRRLQDLAGGTNMP